MKTKQIPFAILWDLRTLRIFSTAQKEDYEHLMFEEIVDSLCLNSFAYRDLPFFILQAICIFNLKYTHIVILIGWLFSLGSVFLDSTSIRN